MAQRAMIAAGAALAALCWPSPAVVAQDSDPAPSPDPGPSVTDAPVRLSNAQIEQGLRAALAVIGAADFNTAPEPPAAAPEPTVTVQTPTPAPAAVSEPSEGDKPSSEDHDPSTRADGSSRGTPLRQGFLRTSPFFSPQTLAR